MICKSHIPEGYKITELGSIPEEWQIKKIGELFNVQQGISMSPARRDGPNKHPFLRTLNVFWRGIDLTTLDYMDFSEKEIEKLNLLPGDLLVCEGGDIGRTAMWRGELESCGYQNHLHRLRVRSNDVNPEFVMFWMQAAMEILGYYREEGNKTTIPNLSQSRLKNFDIPLPPLPEQHAIATTLRTVQEAKERTDAVIAATKSLKAAMMKHLFTYGPVPPEEAERVALNETEIGPVPVDWEIKQFEDFCILQRGQDLRICDIQAGTIPVIGATTTIGYHNVANVKGPGVTVVRSGSSSGKSLYIEEDFWAHNVVLYVKNFKGNNPKFVHYKLQQLDLTQYKSGVSVPTLNRNTFSMISVDVPPKKIQDKIVDTITPIERKLAAEQSSKEALDTLFTSLLHDLMTAKIRVKNIA